MRAIVAVLLLVSAAHAALWGLLQDKQPAPDFTGMLPSLSYTPFEPGHVVDPSVDPERIRADVVRSKAPFCERLFTTLLTEIDAA